MRFSLVSLSGERIDSEALRGRGTIVLLFASYDVVSQMAVRVLEDVRHEHRPRVNAVGVALEVPRNDVLVRAFTESLELGFPVAMADAATRAGQGPFGAIAGIPTWIVLNPAGREVWRHAGPVRATDVHAVLDSALPARKAR